MQAGPGTLRSRGLRKPPGSLNLPGNHHMEGPGLRQEGLIKKAWVFILVPYMDPKTLGL